MLIEKSLLKFTKSEETGELIGFVSRHSKTKQLRGVHENSTFGKKICVLSADLKGTVIPNILYRVEMKSMHSANGYVVVSAKPALFKAHIETVVLPQNVYQVNVTFGNKTVYFDPKNGKSHSSRTIEGVLAILNGRGDIENQEAVIEDFKEQAEALLQEMKKDCGNS
jgi:hypothetical protein